jgi:hypothetical protein
MRRNAMVRTASGGAPDRRERLAARAAPRPAKSPSNPRAQSKVGAGAQPRAGFCRFAGRFGCCSRQSVASQLIRLRRDLGSRFLPALLSPLRDPGSRGGRLRRTMPHLRSVLHRSATDASDCQRAFSRAQSGPRAFAAALGGGQGRQYRGPANLPHVHELGQDFASRSAPQLNIGLARQ